MSIKRIIVSSKWPHQLKQTAGWFESMSKEHQEEYIKEHPESKYAGKTKDVDDSKADSGKKEEKVDKPVDKAVDKPEKKEDDKTNPDTKNDKYGENIDGGDTEKDLAATFKSLPGTPKEKQELHGVLHRSKDAIAHTLKKELVHVHGSFNALKALSHGEKMTDDHKESLKKVATKVVDVAMDHIPGGPLAKLMAKVGMKLVYVGYKKIRAKHNKDPKQDHVKSLVETVIESVKDAAREEWVEKGLEHSSVNTTKHRLKASHVSKSIVVKQRNRSPR